jgi:hypothetical protein
MKTKQDECRDERAFEPVDRLLSVLGEPSQISEPRLQGVGNASRKQRIFSHLPRERYQPPKHQNSA